MGALQQQYDAAAADLADLRSKAAARLAGDEAAAAAEAQVAQDANASAHAALSGQLETAKLQLTTARAEATEASGVCASVCLSVCLFVGAVVAAVPSTW
jgi:hypothetical protein